MIGRRAARCRQPLRKPVTRLCLACLQRDRPPAKPIKHLAALPTATYRGPHLFPSPQPVSTRRREPNQWLMARSLAGWQPASGQRSRSAATLCLQRQPLHRQWASNVARWPRRLYIIITGQLAGLPLTVLLLAKRIQVRARGPLLLFASAAASASTQRIDIEKRPKSDKIHLPRCQTTTTTTTTIIINRFL